MLKQLISKAEEAHRPAKFSWNYIRKFMANMGVEEFNYDSFQTVYDNDPSIQELVSDFDQNTITLGNTNTPDATVDQGSNSVKTSAMRAAHQKLS